MSLLSTLADDARLLALLDSCRFPPEGSLPCAVSGGADSAALLILAALTGRPVTALHVDHGLREGSGAESERVASLAQSLGADFIAHRVVVPDGGNIEERARLARREVLPDDVLMGHTADDRAETVLLQLLRGGSLDALASMSPHRRPLLRLRRADTETACRLTGYEWFEDPSNQDPRHRRNRMRHEVMPLLTSVMGRDPVPLLARAAELAGPERDLLDLLAADVDPTSVVALNAAPLPLARRAVRAWLRDTHPPDAAAVERVLDVARGKVIGTEVSGGRRVSRHRGRLQLSDP